MFHSLVQWAAVVTALPVVMLLCMLVALAVSPYRMKRLRILLIRQLLVDMHGFLAHTPSLRVGERDLLLRVTSECERACRKEEEGLDEDERLQEEAAAALRKWLGDPNPVATGALLEQHRRDLWKQAREGIEGRLVKAAPTEVARLGRLWVWVEAMRALHFALLREGKWAGVSLVARAGRDVTSASVVGLVTSVFAWYFVRRYQADFLLYIANGVTLGAFLGLGTTSVAAAREVVAPAWEGGRGRKGKLALLIAGVTVVAIQVLTYVGPSWWPTTGGH
jgi:hypothetical protein